MEDLIARYGLLAVFLGAYVEGDMAVIFSGVLAQRGLVDYVTVLLVGFTGGLLRDVTCYAVGRSNERARESRFYASTAAAVERLAGRFGPLQILLAPFVYGVRAPSMIFWGVRRLSLPRFLALDLVACTAWAVTFSGAGYFLSDRAEDVIGDVKSAEKWLLGAALVAATAVLLWRRLWKRS